jgi:AsmA protein
MNKYWWIFAALWVFIVLAGLIAVPFLIDVNQFRPQLEAQASTALGRKVTLGHLRLSLLRGYIVAHDIEIADNPSFNGSSFLTADSLRIDVEMKPLVLHKQLHVTGILINHPQIMLLRRDDGVWNFSDMASAGQNVSASTSTPSADQISIAKFNVKDGKVTISALNRPASVKTFDHVNITLTDIAKTSQVGFNLTTLLPGGGDATLTGKVGPADTENVARTPLQAALKINSLHIESCGFIDPASGIAGVASLDGSLVSDGATATLTGKFSGSDLKLAPGGTPARTAVSVNYTAHIKYGDLSGDLAQGDIAVGKAQAHLTGTFQNSDQGTAVAMHLSAPNLAIDELQPMMPALAVRLPQGSHLQGGTLSADLTIKGPLTAPVITGPVKVTNTTLVGFNMGQQLGKSAAYAGKAVSTPDTYVASMSFVTTMTRTEVRSDNIVSDIPSVGISTGSGTMSPTGVMNYTVLAYPTGGTAGKLIKMSTVGGGNGRIPVTITGTIENPIITPDVKASAKILAGETAKGAVSVPVHAVGGFFSRKKEEVKAAIAKKKQEKAEKESQQNH